MGIVHIAIKEVQTTISNAVHNGLPFTGKVVALHLGNGTGEAYLCNHIVQYISLSRLNCHILNLANNTA